MGAARTSSVDEAPSSHLVTSIWFSPPRRQDNASKLLLALMESRHDSENAERILFNLRPRELVRLLEKYLLSIRTPPVALLVLPMLICPL